MKAFSVFKKNMKIVSRNWTYFAVLFLCPLILISIASFALNSADVSNVKYSYGFQNGSEEFGSELDLESFPEPINEKPVPCSKAFSVHEDLGFCIDKESDKKYKVYLDNTNKVGSSRAKKILLENIAEKQSYQANKTSNRVEGKINSYLLTLGEAEKELEETHSELEDQEVMLQDYQNKIGGIQSDFDQVYEPTKESIEKIRSYSDFSRSESISEELNRSQQKIESIDKQLGVLEDYLDNVLPNARYGVAKNHVDRLRGNLSKINDSLESIEDESLATDFNRLNKNLDVLERNLESIKSQLDEMEGDIDSALKNTRESKSEVKSYQNEISQAKKELSGLSNSVGDNVIDVDFKDRYSLPDDPVFLKFPLLVSLIVVFTSLVLSNMFIIKKVGEPSYSRELFSPLSSSQILLSDYMANMVFVLIQSVVIFAFGSYMFDLTAGFSLIFFLAIFVISSILLFFGMGIGYILRNNNISVLVTVFLLMALLILSSAMVPPMMASPLVSFIMEFSPLEILSSILSSSFFLGSGIEAFGPYVSNLVVLLVSGLVFLVISQKINKKKTLH